MMRYCTKCVMPDTKPDLRFDEEGVCSACRNYEKRQATDWNARANELEEVLKRYRSGDGSNWDCIVPVSGGKDSHFQVIRLLELGMNPLCVTATTCDLSEIGGRNIKNIKNLGVDYVEFSPNPAVRRKLNRIGLTQVGDISWPERPDHTVPVMRMPGSSKPMRTGSRNGTRPLAVQVMIKPTQSSRRATAGTSWLDLLVRLGLAVVMPG